MMDHGQPGWIRRMTRRCSRVDVVSAFRAVDQEIRLKHARLAAEGVTLTDVCELARRIRDQRELVRQITDARNRRHARRLLRLNKRHRLRLLSAVRDAGLDTNVLVFR
jgi:hypothetical protein